jgi:cobalt-zinc-cadmium resistance protein CzcA
VNGLVEFALKHRVLMVVLFAMVMVGGLVAFRQLNIEAYPDPTPPMVDIITQSPGLSAEEIERYITIPIETQTAGLRNLNGYSGDGGQGFHLKADSDSGRSRTAFR